MNRFSMVNRGPIPSSDNRKQSVGYRLKLQLIGLHCGAQALWKDRQGQDLIEYALLAAFGALAVAVILPQTLLTEVSRVFSRVISGLILARSTG
jgi:Flp pilus assembly pilin Flp